MDIRLLLSTFAFIFLAELGDKTQLAAFAASAGTKSPWSVFVGASLALILSTLIAVLVGSTLQRFIPLHYLKIGAGALFLLFGTLILIEGLRSRPGEPLKAAEPRPGVLAHLVLRLASDFERAASADYRALAASTKDAALRAMLEFLASEEESHLARVTGLSDQHGQTTWQSGGMQPIQPLGPDAAKVDQSRSTMLGEAARHEEATAGFYEELARTMPTKSLKAVFASLAAEERGHAQKLRSFAETGLA